MRSAPAYRAGRSLFVKVLIYRWEHGRPAGVSTNVAGLQDAGECQGFVLGVSLVNLVWHHRSTGDHWCQEAGKAQGVRENAVERGGFAAVGLTGYQKSHCGPPGHILAHLC
jgi:hypothetical protein